MSTGKIREHNFKLLENLRGDEHVGIDSSGRLYIVSASDVLGLAQACFSRMGSAVDKVAIEYAADKLKEHTFKEIQQGSTHYLNLQKKLSALGLINASSSFKIAHAWYSNRIEYLVANGFSIEVATAMAVTELCLDPHVPEDFKALVRPEMTSGGTSGSYFIKDLKGNKIGVFKPQDEEIYMPNNPKGYREPFGKPRVGPRAGHIQGCSWQKEIAAWEIDQGKFAHVPPTMPVTLLFPETPGSAHIIPKPGSFQLFAEGVPMSALTTDQIMQIPVEEVQNIAIFDLAIVNADRNSGNWLYDQRRERLTPIDHGLTLLDGTDWLEQAGLSEINCHWLSLPQVQAPLNENARQWVLNYDIDAKCRQMSTLLPSSSIRAHKIQMIFLKTAVQKGMTIEQIGKLCMQTGEEDSLTWLDNKIMQAKFSLIENNDFENEELFYTTFQNIIEAEL